MWIYAAAARRGSLSLPSDHHPPMSLSAASSPRRLVDRDPFDDPRYVLSKSSVNDFLPSSIDQSTGDSEARGIASSLVGGDMVHKETFYQILELDEDDEREFSSGMASAYCDQARSTYKQMEDAFQEKDLPKLSSLGHFLKGSSAALGMAKVQASCERMQHYGKCRDEETESDLTASEALDRIGDLLVQVGQECIDAEKWLVDWYAKKKLALDITADWPYGPPPTR